MKKILITIALLLVLLIPQVSFAAIAFDTFVKGADAINIQGLTYSHTVTGSNPALAVCIFANNSGDAVTGVTYAGVSMTQVAKIVRADYALQYGYLYYLPNPATGANNVIVSASVPITNSTVYSYSYTGVKNAAVENANSAAVSSSGTASVAVTTIDANAVIVSCFMGFNGDTTLTAGTNVTKRANDNYVLIGDSIGNSLASGSNTVSATLTSQQWVALAASIAPASAAIIPYTNRPVLFNF